MKMEANKNVDRVPEEVENVIRELNLSAETNIALENMENAVVQLNNLQPLFQTEQAGSFYDTEHRDVEINFPLEKVAKCFKES